MEKVIRKNELKELIDKLENGVDKFIIAGLYYGLNGNNDYREQFLAIEKKQVNLDNSTITLEDGRVVVMDSLLKSVTEEAMNQEVYVKIGGIDDASSNEDYELNTKSPYVIKTKPTSRNNFGMLPLTNAGFKTRIRSISEFLVGDTSITPTSLRFSGAYDLIARQNKKICYTEAEKLLKENGLIIRRNKLVEMLKEINGIK